MPSHECNDVALRMCHIVAFVSRHRLGRGRPAVIEGSPPPRTHGTATPSVHGHRGWLQMRPVIDPWPVTDGQHPLWAPSTVSGCQGVLSRRIRRLDFRALLITALLITKG